MSVAFTVSRPVRRHALFGDLDGMPGIHALRYTLGNRPLREVTGRLKGNPLDVRFMHLYRYTIHRIVWRAGRNLLA